MPPKAAPKKDDKSKSVDKKGGKGDDKKPEKEKKGNEKGEDAEKSNCY